MKTLSKYAVAAALAGAVAFAAAPAQARWNGHGHHGYHHGGGAAAIIGLGAGALLGAAAANANSGYYGPGYDDYGYVPAPEAYDAAPVYVQPAPNNCWHSTDSNRGFGYYGRCY